ncbi:unnamed protein product, partial [Brenthis ino]
MKSDRKCDKTLSTTKLLILVTLGFILLAIPLVLLAIDPVFLIYKYVARISNGTEFYNVMKQENPGARIELYIFNVTNTESFLSGKDYKMKVEEVGPFNYQEYRTNKQFKFDEKTGLMSYIPFTRTEFLPHLSVGDPKLINVTVPNAAILAMSSMVSTFPFWTKAAFNMLATRLQSKPIVKLNAESLLWGYEDPLITLGNTILPGWIHFKSIGILDRLYDQTQIPVLEVSARNEEKFKVKSVDGCQGLKVLGFDNPSMRSRCNTFEDTYEGFAYPPGLTKDDRLRLYRSIFCRMLDFDLVRTDSTDVSPYVFVYEISNTTYSINQNNECLCANKDQCIDGVSSISPCLQGLGIGLSNAHFLHADPKIYERIDGMNPNVEKHGSKIVIDPKVGLVLSTSFTIQVNVIVQNVNFNSQVKPFSNMVVPLAYFKIISSLTDENKNNVKAIYYLYPYIFHAIETIALLLGVVTIAYAVCRTDWSWYKKSKFQEKHKNVAPISSETPLINENNKDCMESESEVSVSLDEYSTLDFFHLLLSASIIFLITCSGGWRWITGSKTVRAGIMTGGGGIGYNNG